MSKRPLVYVCVKMTGKFMDELVMDAEQMTRMLNNHGFEVLHPVLIENVPRIHEVLEQTDGQRLDRYWLRDKQCLKECHLIFDDRSCNKSDGVGVELGLARFCYWKPVLRIFPEAGICISKIEYDHVFESRIDGVKYMQEHFGSTRKILLWRLRMLARSLPTFILLQARFLFQCL